MPFHCWPVLYCNVSKIEIIWKQIYCYGVIRFTALKYQSCLSFFFFISFFFWCIHALPWVDMTLCHWGVSYYRTWFWVINLFYIYDLDLCSPKAYLISKVFLGSAVVVIYDTCGMSCFQCTLWNSFLFSPCPSHEWCMLQIKHLICHL